MIIGVTTSVDQKNDKDHHHHHRISNKISPKARSEEMNSPPCMASVDNELLFSKSKSVPLSPTIGDLRNSPFEGVHPMSSLVAISEVCKLMDHNKFGKVVAKNSEKNGKKPSWTTDSLKERKLQPFQNDHKIANPITKSSLSPNHVSTGKNLNSGSSEPLIQSDPINLITHNRD